MTTEIYGTIGPACCDTDTLVCLFEKGMTGVRINLSHSSLADAAGWIAQLHGAWKIYLESHKPCCRSAAGPKLLMDLRGPELRIGKLLLERTLFPGDCLTLTAEEENHLSDPAMLPVPMLIIRHLTAGQEILLDDGKILLTAEECFSGNIAVKCRVIRGGVIKSCKSIALPGQELNPPTLTDSDYRNIADAKKYGITGVMLPFVRERGDLENLKAALRDAGAENIRIFAKIENECGMIRLPELLPECDEIVIARGDLGNAMPLWKLPAAQEQIAAVCRSKKHPFMVVTQLLASMERSPVPTRAEVSDIFRAVSQGAASVMLTGETAAGNYPVEAMEYLVNTVREAEQYFSSEKLPSLTAMPY